MSANWRFPGTWLLGSEYISDQAIRQFSKEGRTEAAVNILDEEPPYPISSNSKFSRAKADYFADNMVMWDTWLLASDQKTARAKRCRYSHMGCRHSDVPYLGDFLGRALLKFTNESDNIVNLEVELVPKA